MVYRSSVADIAKKAKGSRIGEGTTDIYAETLEVMERKLITKILSETFGNQSQAAELIGVTRGSERNKIRVLGIVIAQVVSTE